MDSATREDLKRNELGEAVGEAIHYAEDHIRTILKIAAGLGIAGVIALVAYLWSSNRNRNANELLVHGLRVFDAPVTATGAKPDDLATPSFATAELRRAKSKEIFGDLDGRYGGTRTGRIAKLYLAQIALAEKDTARAHGLWQEFLKSEPEGTLAATARVNLWKLDRTDGKAEAVVAEIQALLAAAEKPLPDDVLLYQLALSYEALGRATDAAGAYRRIVDEHPNSPYLAEAQRGAGPATPSSPAA